MQIQYPGLQLSLYVLETCSEESPMANIKAKPVSWLFFRTTVNDDFVVYISSLTAQGVK